MKFQSILISIIALQALYLNQADAITVNNDSKILARCEMVYLYNSHLAIMQNNEGLAKNMLFRASSVVAANMMLSENDGNVSGEILAVWRKIGI